MGVKAHDLGLRKCCRLDACSSLPGSPQAHPSDGNGENQTSAERLAEFHKTNHTEVLVSVRGP